MRRIIVILGLLPFLLFCGKEEDNPEQLGFCIDEFPLTVGNWWQYQLLDHTNHYKDTIIMEVVEKNIIDGVEEFDCVISKDGNFYQSCKFIRTDNQISFEDMNPNNRFFGSFQLTFPMQTGDAWMVEMPGDTLKVHGVNESITFFGKEYFSIYSISRRYYYSPSDRMINYMWISPDVGILNQAFNYAGPNNILLIDFFLIDYYIQ